MATRTASSVMTVTSGNIALAWMASGMPAISATRLSRLTKAGAVHEGSGGLPCG